MIEIFRTELGQADLACAVADYINSFRLKEEHILPKDVWFRRDLCSQDGFVAVVEERVSS